MTWWLFFYSKRLRKIQEKKKKTNTKQSTACFPFQTYLLSLRRTWQSYFCYLCSTIIALCEKQVISYEERISLTPLSASGIRLNINLKYICAYSVLQVLLTNSSKRHSAPHGDIHYTVLKQITDLHDLSTVFYPIFYSGPFIKSGMLNFKTQGALPFSFFLNQVPWVLLPWD